MKSHKFIFICGLHRSGTSILFRSLREHPDISGFQESGSPEDEGMHLQSVYKPSGYYGGAGKFAFSKDAHITESSTLITDVNREKLFGEWSLYWDLHKPFLLEKSPPNLIRTRFLQKMFPESYFIIMQRHPVAVTYATRRWYKKFGIYFRNFSSIFQHWVIAHEIFKSDENFLRNRIIINYEDFVSNPHDHLRKIYSFLSIDPYPCHQHIHSDVNRRYFDMWCMDTRHFLISRMREKIVSKYEERVNIFGYSLEYPFFLTEVRK